MADQQGTFVAAIKAIGSFAKTNPVKTVVVGSGFGVLYMHDKNPALLPSLSVIFAPMFNQLPSGWVLTSVGLIAYSMLRLNKQFADEREQRKQCDAERVLDRLRIQALERTIEDELFPRLKAMDRRKAKQPVTMYRRSTDTAGNIAVPAKKARRASKVKP